MAGQPGKSGGARQGAGRPKKQPLEIQMVQTDDPKVFLTQMMNDPAAEPRMRMDAAKALLPFTHAKLGEGGKKDQKDAAAKKVAGRFAAGAPPKLVAAGGKKV